MYSIQEMILETATLNPRLGKCYELSGRYVLHNPEAVLVHGCITNPKLGKNRSILHAWVALPGDEYFDPVTDLSWKCDAFEMFYKPVQIFGTYDHLQVCTNIIRFRHWGPWAGPSK